jgi:hypothetical protein
MNRIALFALFVVAVWYVWWRIRRRFAALMAAARGRERREAVTLEKDPSTGVYRPPRR